VVLSLEVIYPIVYIKGAEFERHQDSIVYRAVSFKDAATFVDAGKLKLNAATSLEEVKKLFPEKRKKQSRDCCCRF
jgi:TATA-box binding protein (TBP) (component of TFIID and TFIIIB)